MLCTSLSQAKYSMYGTKRQCKNREKKKQNKGTTSPFRLDKDIISRTGGNRYAIHKEDLQSRKDERV